MDGKLEPPVAGDGDMPTRSRVEIVGDPAAITTRFEEKLANSVLGDVAQISERFREAGAFASLEGLRKSIAESVKAIDSVGAGQAQKAALGAAMRNLRATELPTLDLGEQITRVKSKPIEFRHIRSVEDIRLEKLTDAVNRLIDVAERQSEALFALDDAMAARHVVSEAHAEERAARADNRSTWNICLAAIASAGSTVALLEVIVR